MNKLLICLAIGVLAGFGLTACVTTSSQSVMPVGSGSSKAELVAELNHHFSGFRKQTALGNCHAAERHMRYLLDGYDSRDKVWEVTMLTDLCLCHIENGEVGRFAACAEELDRYADGMKILDRETQFVKQLSAYFSGYAGNESLIDTDIRTGFTQLLGEKEGQ